MASIIRREAVFSRRCLALPEQCAQSASRCMGHGLASHSLNMSAERPTVSPEVLRRVLWIQTLTLIWMSLEAVVSLGAAWMAQSSALLTFGGDSAVELLSAVVVLRRFSAPSHEEHVEEQAGRITGGLLFVLAAFVLTSSVLTLLGHVEARPSRVGIALLVLAAIIMPWPAAQKWRPLHHDCQCGFEGRCCRVDGVRLSGPDCSCGFARQCRLERELGRPYRRASVAAADCA
jgi:hypothetical protein